MAIPRALTASLNAMSAVNFIPVSLGIGLNNSDEKSICQAAHCVKNSYMVKKPIIRGRSQTGVHECKLYAPLSLTEQPAHLVIVP